MNGTNDGEGEEETEDGVEEMDQGYENEDDQEEKEEEVEVPSLERAWTHTVRGRLRSGDKREITSSSKRCECHDASGGRR